MEGTTGIGLAGSAGVNSVIDVAEAYINDYGALTLNPTDDVSVTSQNDASIIAVNGSIAYGAPADFTFGLAGTFSFNDLALDTRSFIDRADLRQVNDVTVTAIREGTLFSLAAGIAGTVASDSAVEIAGSVAHNVIANRTITLVNGASITGSGILTLDAQDLSEILTIGRGGSFAVTGSGQASGAGSVGASVAINDVTSDVFAHVLGSDLTLDGNVSLDALADTRIESFTIGGAVTASGSNMPALAGALAGSGSGNTVRTDVEAVVAGNSTVTSHGGRVDLQANDDSEIRAVSGGFAIALSLSTLFASAGSFAVGISASENDIESNVDADIDQSVVTSLAGVGVLAGTTLLIDALSMGGTLAGASADQTGFAGSGAGAGSGNTVRNKVRSRVRGSSTVTTTDSSGDVTIEATDDSAIVADAGGVAVAIARSATTNLNLSIGASVALNDITNETEAQVSGSTIDSDGEVDLLATSMATIDALTIAGALSAAIGGTGTTAQFAGAGAGSGNAIANTITAEITDTSTVTTGTTFGLSVAATDSATINADAGAVGIALGLGGAGTNINLSFGASAAVNDIANETTASLSVNPDVTAGDVAVTATSDPTINVLTVAGAGAGSLGGAGKFGFAFSGAGTGSLNAIANKVTAESEGGTVTGTVGGVNVTASDTSTIDSLGVGGSIAISGGGTVEVSVSVGVSVVENRVGNIVTADVSGATVTGETGVTVSATSMSTITGEAVGVSVSGAVSTSGNVAISGTGAGASSHNDVDNTTEATVSGDSTVTVASGDLNVTASDTSTITALGTGGSLGFSFTSTSTSVTASAGVGIAENEINNMVTADINALTVDASNVSVGATSDATIDSQAIAVSVAAALTNPSTGVSVSLSGAGVGSTNAIANTISASIQDGTITATNDINVLATDTATITSEAPAVDVSLGLFAVAIGVSDSQNTVTNQVDAFVTGAALIATKGEVTVDATSTATAFADQDIVALGVGVGLAGAVATSETTIGGHTRAYLGNGADLTANSGLVTVEANSMADATADLLGGSSSALGITAMFVTAEVTGDTTAYVGEGVKVTADELAITATGTNTASPNMFGVAAGVAGGNGGQATATIDRDTVAYTGAAYDTTATGTTETSTTGAFNVEAISTNTASAYAEGGAGGGISITAFVAEATIGEDTESAATRAFLGDGAEVLTAGSLDIDANATNTVFADLLTVGVGILSGGGGEAKAIIGAPVEAFIDSDSVTVTGMADVTASLTESVDSVADGGSGGGISVANFLSDAKSQGKVRAGITADSVIDANGLNVLAEVVSRDVTAEATLGSVGLGAVAASTTNAEVSGDVEAFVETGATVTSPGGNVSIAANVGNTTAHSELRGGSGGVVAAGNVFDSTSDITGNVRTTIGERASLTGLDITVTADSTHTSSAEMLPGGVGVIAFSSDAEARADSDTLVEVQVGPATTPVSINTLTELHASGDITLSATSSHTTVAEMDGWGGGLISEPTMFVGTDLKGNTLTSVGQYTSIDAGGNVTVQSDATRTSDADMTSSTGGAVDTANGDIHSVISMTSEVAVADHSSITSVDALTLLARTMTEAYADVELDNGGIAALPESLSQLTVTTTAKVGVGASSLAGGSITVKAETAKLDVNTVADSTAKGLGTDVDSTATTTATPRPRSRSAPGRPSMAARASPSRRRNRTPSGSRPTRWLTREVPSPSSPGPRRPNST